MWNGQTLAVVLPTYNEAESINECIRGFEALGIVDDIVVVDNNAHPDTAAEVATTSARVVQEVVQGYGAAIQRGIAETLDADLVCICEPDGTFDPDDILKLLPFTADVDVVFGSRTVRIFILSGANMGLFLKWGNWAVAKLTEVLFNTVYLSDVGCTYRVLTRDAIDRLRPEFRSTGSAFGYEMMLLTVEQRLPLVQVPVKYQPRVGESSVTGNKMKAFWLGLDMISGSPNSWSSSDSAKYRLGEQVREVSLDGGKQLVADLLLDRLRTPGPDLQRGVRERVVGLAVRDAVVRDFDGPRPDATSRKHATLGDQDPLAVNNSSGIRASGLDVARVFDDEMGHDRVAIHASGRIRILGTRPDALHVPPGAHWLSKGARAEATRGRQLETWRGQATRPRLATEMSSRDGADEPSSFAVGSRESFGAVRGDEGIVDLGTRMRPPASSLRALLAADGLEGCVASSSTRQPTSRSTRSVSCDRSSVRRRSSAWA